MHSIKYLTAAAATGLLLAGSSFSQVERQTGERPAATPNQQSGDAAFRVDQWVDMDDLIGMDVKLEASREDKREAAEDGERAEGGNGEVSDILFNRADGSLEWAVVSCGGWAGIGDKKVLMPIDSLRWNAAEECFYVGITEDQVEALPEFDLEKAREQGLDGAISTYDATWKRMGAVGSRPVDASSKTKPSHAQAGQQGTVQTFGDKRFAPVAWSFLSASELDGVDVYAQENDFADVATFIVDHDAHKIAYIVLSHGGIGDLGDTKYVVPFSSLSICHLGDADDEDPQTVFCSTKSESEMKRCIEYEEPEKGALSQATLAQLRAQEGSSGIGAQRRPGQGQ